MKTRSCERVFGFYEDIRRLARHCGFNNDRITDLSPHCSSHNDPAAILFDHPNKKNGRISCARLNLNQSTYLFLCFWEFNSKSRADSFCAFHIDFTFVGFDQVFDNGETESRAA